MHCAYIVELIRAVRGARDDLAIADEDGADGHFAAHQRVLALQCGHITHHNQYQQVRS